MYISIGKDYGCGWRGFSVGIESAIVIGVVGDRGSGAVVGVIADCGRGVVDFSVTSN